MFIPAVSKAGRPGNPATPPPAPMNGFAASAKSRESNARIVLIADFIRSLTKSLAGTFLAGMTGAWILS